MARTISPSPESFILLVTINPIRIPVWRVIIKYIWEVKTKTKYGSSFGRDAFLYEEIQVAANPHQVKTQFYILITIVLFSYYICVLFWIAILLLCILFCKIFIYNFFCMKACVFVMFVSQERRGLNHELFSLFRLYPQRARRYYK